MFEKSGIQIENALSKIGILHLPKNYRSAFIIDGQHRLYGYANSEYKIKNSIPVVAFIDLDRKEQVRLFMQINENQKAVPKNLRNTLNSDLLWNSDNIIEQIKALKLQIAQDLGEDKASPLYDRVIVGENPKTSKRCITIDTIKIGLDRSNFFGLFSKTSIRQDGTFYKGNNEETYRVLFPFLLSAFDYVKENLKNEWEIGESDNGFLAINAGIESLIRIFSDVVDLLNFKGGVNTKSDKLNKVLTEFYYYIDPLLDYFKSLTNEQKLELKKSYGTGGRAKYWRILQREINKERKDFIPDGFEKYWNDEAQTFNEESFKIIRDLETYMKNDFKKRLLKEYGENWFKQGVPQSVYMDSHSRAAQKNLEITSKQDEVTPWDCLNIIDYRRIASHGRNWSSIFEKEYTKPGEEKIRGGKESKTKWMHNLEKIRNQNFHSYSVKEEEYNFLRELYEWLIEKRVENDID